MDPKKQNLRFYSSNIACQQYWSSENVCLELKVLMSSFSTSEAVARKFFVKKVFLKILQNPLKNIRDTAFNLIKFHANGQQLYWKETPAYGISLEFIRWFKNTYFAERRRAAVCSGIHFRIQNSSTG